MSIVIGPSIVSTGTNGLIYLFDPGNIKSYDYRENLYPTSETLDSFVLNSPASPFFSVPTGGPYNGRYYVTTSTNGPSGSHYWFEWGNNITVNAGDYVTQTWHVRPVVTATNTLTDAGVRFWSGAGRAWLGFTYAQFNFASRNAYGLSGTGTTATITLLDNGWYKLTMGAIADVTGFSGASLYLSGLVNTGTCYQFASCQVERNTVAGPYTPTYGTAVTRSRIVNDLTRSYSTSSMLAKPTYDPSNGGVIVSNTTTLGNYINTPIIGSTTFTSSSSFSMSAWFNATDYVYTTTNSACGCIVGAFGYDGFGLGWFTNGTTSTLLIVTQMRTRAGGPYQFGVGSAYNTPLNTWTHYTFVYDFINGISSLYVNGVQNAWFNINRESGTWSYTNIIGQPISIGGPFAPGGPAPLNFPGKLGPVTIHNRALGELEVKQLFNAYRGRYNL